MYIYDYAPRLSGERSLRAPNSRFATLVRQHEWRRSARDCRGATGATPSMVVHRIACGPDARSKRNRRSKPMTIQDIKVAGATGHPRLFPLSNARFSTKQTPCSQVSFKSQVLPTEGVHGCTSLIP